MTSLHAPIPEHYVSHESAQKLALEPVELVLKLLFTEKLKRQIRTISDVTEALCLKGLNELKEDTSMLVVIARCKLEHLCVSDLALVDRVASQWRQA